MSGRGDEDERERLYEIANSWLRMARHSADKGDYQGERHALDYVREIIRALRKRGDAE